MTSKKIDHEYVSNMASRDPCCAVCGREDYEHGTRGPRDVPMIRWKRSDEGFKSGPHLGVVRRWIQRKAVNGDRVTWGSQEQLHFHRMLTPNDMDCLSQAIADAVLRDALRQLPRLCNEFESWGTAEGGERADVCKRCSLREYWHKLKESLA